jgi:hypothetical protein
VQSGSGSKWQWQKWQCQKVAVAQSGSVKQWHKVVVAQKWQWHKSDSGGKGWQWHMAVIFCVDCVCCVSDDYCMTQQPFFVKATATFQPLPLF